MNEGKQKLEAMRRMLKKKNNNQNALGLGNNLVGVNDAESSSKKIIIDEKGVEENNEEKTKQLQNRLQREKEAVKDDQYIGQRKDKVLQVQVRGKQALEEGQIQQEEGEIKETQEKKVIGDQKTKSTEQQQAKSIEEQANTENLKLQHTKVQPSENQQSAVVNPVKEKDIVMGSVVNEFAEPMQLQQVRGSEQNKQQEYHKEEVNHNEQNQNNQIDKNLAEEERLNCENKPKVSQAEQHQQNNSIAEAHPHSSPPQQVTSFSALSKQPQKIVEQGNEHKVNEPKEHFQQQQKVSNDEKTKLIQQHDHLQTNQSLNIQLSVSHHANSAHIERKAQTPISQKPTVKIVLKQLQMIKTSIHNLNVTYRGVQYLREKIKQDTFLKRKIRQRLMDLQGDDEMDVLRKLVKKIQSSSSQQYQQEGQKADKVNENRNNPQKNIDSALINQQQISSKLISQPEISVSNEAIEY